MGHFALGDLALALGLTTCLTKPDTYNCVYCQLGITTSLTVAQRCFYNCREVVSEVTEFLKRFGGYVDYVTLVPDGVPTLDACIGRVIDGVKREAGVRVAVLTNASLLWLDDVRSDLMEADYTSIKLDAVDERVWRAVNRPHQALRLGGVLSSILEFSKRFRGCLFLGQC